MSKIEKIIERIYIAGGLVLLMVVIMAMSSCSNKVYWNGSEVKAKSKCGMKR
tara:strand:+ start:275 stop:430 length:156 start_codon:yes stop_codon:yes gene_type:complete